MIIIVMIIIIIQLSGDCLDFLHMSLLSQAHTDKPSWVGITSVHLSLCL